MTDVVLDTNALLLPFTDGTDLEHELTGLLGAVRILVPASIMAELAGLAGGQSNIAASARAAQRLAERFEVAATDLPGDDGLLDVARRSGAAVVTNDRTLQAEARRSGLVVIAPRGRGRLHRV